MRKIYALLLFIALFIPVGAIAQIISTVAGDSIYGYNGENVAADTALLESPAGIAIDNSGNIYFSEYGGNRIRRISAAGIVTTIAGTGTAGFSGNGGPATAAEINEPIGVAIDNSGNILFADTRNNCVRKIDAAGIISTFAGDTAVARYAFGGDGGPATAASFKTPVFLAVDASNNVYITDGGNNRVRKVDPSGIISTFAGSDTMLIGDGGAATNAKITSPAGIAIDGTGNIYVVTGGFDSTRIRKINSAGVIATVAGPAAPGFHLLVGDGGPATAASFNEPEGIACDAAGNIYIADTYNGRIRMINSAGIVSTVAGNAHCCFSGDGGPATAARIGDPLAVAFDRAGNLYFTDGNAAIRKINYATSVGLVAAPAEQMWLYPNPSVGEFTVDVTSKHPGYAHVVVTNVAGTKIREFSAETNRPVQIDMRAVPPGIYFVTVATAENRWCEKLVVAK